MCGRFSLFYTEDFTDRYQVDKLPVKWQDRYNIAPGQETLVITRNSPNKAVLMKWGLVPFWAKDPSIGFRMINARLETLLVKPSFRQPLRSKRCLVPSSGFYEWKKEDKQPYFIKPPKGYLSFAGLYDEWIDPEGQKLTTFTIITRQANNQVEPIHNRMPVVLDEASEEHWLDKNSEVFMLVEKVKNINKTLDIYPVSKAVNMVSTDGRELIEPQK